MSQPGVPVQPPERIGTERRAAPLLSSLAVASEFDRPRLRQCRDRLLVLVAGDAIHHDELRAAPEHDRYLGSLQWQHSHSP
jgi:hypothetical protein